MRPIIPVVIVVVVVTMLVIGYINFSKEVVPFDEVFYYRPANATKSSLPADVVAPPPPVVATAGNTTDSLVPVLSPTPRPSDVVEDLAPAPLLPSPFPSSRSDPPVASPSSLASISSHPSASDSPSSTGSPSPIPPSSSPSLSAVIAAASPSPSASTSAAAPHAPVVLVLAHYDEDVSWLHQQPYPHVLMVKGRPAGTPNNTPGNGRGREAVSYLQYIVDNYDHLPDRMIFMHAHRVAWHVQDIVEILRVLNPFAYEYAGLSNRWANNLQESDYYKVKAWWQDMSLNKAIADPYPNQRFGFQFVCCATFVVSRARVQGRPLSLYKALLEWIKNTHLDDQESGRYFEWTWHVLMGENWIGTLPNSAVLCPKNPPVCANQPW